jgi:DNA-binding MarR family transcriptional regulator
MPDEDQEPLVDEYFAPWVLIARERDYQRFGISNERRVILFISDSNDGRATPVEIARDLFRELHSVTGMLTRMEAAGLISRHKGSGRSKVEVRLTDEGRDVLRRSGRNEADKRILSTLTKRERERLASCLGKVRSRALEDLGIREWEGKRAAARPG